MWSSSMLPPLGMEGWICTIDGKPNHFGHSLVECEQYTGGFHLMKRKEFLSRLIGWQIKQAIVTNNNPGFHIDLWLGSNSFIVPKK